MSDDRIDMIIDRLENLEAALAELSAAPPQSIQSAPPPPPPPPAVAHVEEYHNDGGYNDNDEGFDEKRVVDLIVRLVGERVDRSLRELRSTIPDPQSHSSNDDHSREGARIDEERIISKVTDRVGERLEVLLARWALTGKKR